VKQPGTRVLVFGEVIFDRFAEGPSVLGGAPFNVAWHLRGFGLAPLFVSRVGDDALGRRVRTEMEAWGMDTSGLQVDPRRPTGVVDVRLEGGEPSFRIVAEQAFDFIAPDEITHEASAFRLLVHGTLALRGDRSGKSFERLVRAGPAATFCDVNLRSPWWDREHVRRLLTRVGTVKLNEGELERLTDGPRDEARIREILSLGPSRVLLTRGERGAALFSMDGCLARVTPTGRERVVDTVGAGDAFSAVFILGLLRGWRVERTMERAQQFAEAVVGKRGATGMDETLYRDFEWVQENRP